MKITRRQLRRLILKEFKVGTDILLPSIDINDLISGDTGFPPPPPESDRGGGGNNCEDPGAVDGRFDGAYNRTLDAFEDYLMTSGLNYISYVDNLRALGASGLEGVSGKHLMDFLSDELLFEIALALCKQKITGEMLPTIFSNPVRFL